MVLKPVYSKLGEAYLDAIAASNKNTADAYAVRLRLFREYTKGTHLGEIDKVLERIKSKELDPYAVLAGFAAYITERGKAPRYQNQVVKTVKNFLEYNDIEISSHKFRLKVRLKKVVDKDKLGLSKEDVYEIIRACEGDLRLLTFVMFLAATGTRATEALHTKIKNLHLDDPKQPFVFIEGEYTKTKKDRTVYLTGELVRQLEKYLTWKYRERRTKYEAGKPSYGKYKPESDREDYVFIPYHHGAELPDIESVYIDLNYRFTRMLDRIGRGEYEDNNPHRRKITFHSFRRFVKTTISDLGFQDYSEYFIGHSGSTYYRKTDKERMELFRKIEPSLTFLDVTAMEAHGADQQSRLDQMQIELQKEREERAKLYELLYKQGIIKKE
jgi:integrase